MHAPKSERVGATEGLAGGAFQHRRRLELDARRMKVTSVFKRVSAGLTAGAVTAMFAVEAAAQELLGQPTPGGIGLQESGSPLKKEVHFFHDAILLPIITIISLFVLGLLMVMTGSRMASWKK